MNEPWTLVRSKAVCYCGGRLRAPFVLLRCGAAGQPQIAQTTPLVQRPSVAAPQPYHRKSCGIVTEETCLPGGYPLPSAPLRLSGDATDIDLVGGFDPYEQQPERAIRSPTPHPA